MLEDFEKIIEVKFEDKALLERVFIHRSYLNEHKSSGLEHNERLEFLGDAVLELATTKFLYEKYDRPEGDLTNWRSALVKGESLSVEAKRLGMNPYIKTSRGEAKNTGKARDIILANAFEALIGAIYLDQGFETATKFILKNICYKLDAILNEGLEYDSKSRFQELVQDEIGVTPTYTVVSEVGPDHSKTFTVAANLGGKEVAIGAGPSKQKAQSDAAQKALEKWEEIKTAL
ncbi:ribonuclease III [Candidatus Berkelbacteria bacterium CG10_big_fil_rev_8_21_14_0_10_43_13]|uniref:Ribonuclease 3 n=1 Tax=Candidatus Berkelbacteria bacterium CG10_big_fil_rev_8_21_14_0_10_43_13 TaxID=1974514 RepID=A0A2H0W669_9BACT|nr:MAG: ribonuclease III [Candidatus Berkelbacteria bacterium CG10_big_fil_rev_8_21_14_0_10_43_13]